MTPKERKKKSWRRRTEFLMNAVSSWLRSAVEASQVKLSCWWSSETWDPPAFLSDICKPLGGFLSDVIQEKISLFLCYKYTEYANCSWRMTLCGLKQPWLLVSVWKSTEWWKNISLFTTFVRIILSRGQTQNNIVGILMNEILILMYRILLDDWIIISY